MAEEQTLADSVHEIDFDPFAGAEISLTVPTTEPQKEIWLSSQLGQDASLSYNESLTLEFRGSLNVAALERALNDVIARHDVLRATVSGDGEMLCIAKELSIALPVEDWSNKAMQDADLAEAKGKEVTTPFDLLDGPLIRARLIRLADDHHVFLLSAHHIVCDGWSFEPMLKDMSKFYSAAVNQSVAELAPADSFNDYVSRHNDPDYLQEIQASQDYWLHRFRSMPPQTEFAADYPRPMQRSFEAERIDWPLSADLLTALHELGARHKCSLMTTMLSVFEVFAFRLTGIRDLVIAIPSAGQLAFDCPALVGHCVNVLPVRAHIEPSLTFSQYLTSRRSQVLSDFEYQKFTYGSLIKSLPVARDPSRMPLTSVMFNIDQRIDGVDFAGLDFQMSLNQRRFEAFEQFFNIALRDVGAVIECQYNINLFDRDLMRHRLEVFETLLEAVVGDPEQKIGDVQLLSSRQSELVLKQWNAGPDRDVPFSNCVDAFKAAVANHGSRAAITFEGQSLSYSQLDEITGKLSRALNSRGIRSGARVGTFLRRSEKLPAGLLGVMRSGAAYVPLDPELPAERLAYISEDAGLSLVICEADLVGHLKGSCSSVCFDELVAEGGDAAIGDSVPITAEMPAYMMYTSGSTGKPKGVEISHGNLANLLSSMSQEPGMNTDDRFLAITTPSFDISILELLNPLMEGAEVIVADAEAVKDAVRLMELLQRFSPTIMQATPSTWRILREAGWEGDPELKVLCGGEALDSALSSWLAGVCGSLWNMYGPTEATIWSTCKHLRPDERVTLGRPIGNTQVYVLDDCQKPMLPGSPGELYIGGLGVARGYWNRDELTTERFISNPFGDGRLYCTGDSVRYLPNGELEYLGRLDNQVKVRGFRIELGEVEVALARHEGISQAVASVYEPTAGDARLVAYFIPRDGRSPDASELRSYLADFLPAYMIPQHFVELDEIPLTPNRKVDRRALPAPIAAASQEYVEPESEAERLLADVWGEVLGIERISAADDFFELGGHSILATRVVSSLRHRTGVALPLRRIFLNPKLKALASHLSALLTLRDSTETFDEHTSEREQVSF